LKETHGEDTAHRNEEKAMAGAGSGPIPATAGGLWCSRVGNRGRGDEGKSTACSGEDRRARWGQRQGKKIAWRLPVVAERRKVEMGVDSEARV
jgi:hypothetical protein